MTATAPLDHPACATHPNPDAVFFPPSEPSHHHLKLVRQICGGCPVRVACLRQALRLGDAAQGIWAGTTERERRDIRRNNRP